MNALKPLAKYAIVNGVLSYRASFLRKNKLGLGLLVLSGLLFFIALLFIILSGYGWLLIHYTQPVAALIMSGGVVMVSLVTGLAGYLRLREKPKSPLQDNEFMQIVSEITDIIGEELAEPIQENPKTAMLLASLAGFIAGDHLH